MSSGSPASPRVVVEGRLHPLAAVLYGFRVVRNVVPLALAVLITDLPDWLPWTLAGLAMAVGVPFGVLSWWRFRYRVEEGRLVVTGGVLVRRRRVVALEHVRGVQLAEPLLHRAVGLVQARVEAAAGGQRGAELSLAAVSRAQGEELRRAVLPDSAARATAAEEPETSEAPPLARPGPGMLAAAGLTSGRHLLVPATILGAALSLVDDVGLGDLAGRFAGAAVDAAPRSAAGIAALALGALVLTAAAAVAGSLLADGGFTLREEEGRLVTTRGLLSRRRTVVDRRRILALEVRDTPLRRLAGLAALDALVGGVAGGDAESPGRVRLLPAGRRADVWALAARIDPEAGPALDPHPRRGLPRRLVRAVALPVAAVGVTAPWAPAWVPLACAAAAALMVPVALDRQRSLGHRLTPARLCLRSGSLMRTHTVVPPGRAAAFSLRESPGQRRAGLATVVVHLGGVGSRGVLDAGAAEGRALLAAITAPVVSRAAPPDAAPRSAARPPR